MTVQWNSKTILCKLEAAEGMDANPDAALNAILTKEFSINPIEGDEVARDVDRATYGSMGSVLSNKRVSVNFKVELQGSGTVDSAAKFAPLLRACGMVETINTGTDCSYDPVTQAPESATFYVYIDDILHKFTGARGNVQVEAVESQFGYFTFDFIGLFTPVVGATPTVADLSGFMDPLLINTSNSNFSLHGFNANLRSLNFDLGNEVTYKSWVGQEGILISGRRSSAEVVIQAPSLGAHDYFSAVDAAAKGPLVFTHGVTAGQIVELSIPQAQVKSIAYGDEDGVATFTLGVEAVITDGDDDVKLITK